MLHWFLRNRSPFRRLEEDEEARLEGIERPRRRSGLFTRALRYGALGLLGYYGVRAALRTPWGQQQWSAFRRRFPGAFDRMDAMTRRGAERFLDWTIEEAVRHPGMPRHRPILTAAQGIQFADRRIVQSLMAQVVLEQLPFSSLEKRRLDELRNVLGLPDEQSAFNWASRLAKEGIFEELLATRTRRNYLINLFGASEASPDFIARLLLASPAFAGYRRKLGDMQLNQDQLEEFTRRYMAPLVYDVVERAYGMRYDVEQVHNDLREYYRSAAMVREIDRSPLTEAMIARGYETIDMWSALGFGYTINDPAVARAFRYVSPEHYRYLDLLFAIPQLPRDIMNAYQRYRVEVEGLEALSGEDRERARRALEEMADKDKMLALGRFLYLREDYRSQLLLQAYDLAGIERPRPQQHGQGIPLFSISDNLFHKPGVGMIESVDRDMLEDVLIELSGIRVSTMLRDPDTGRVVDLSYVQGAMEYARQGMNIFGIPVAPGMFLLQPLRMFPWFRPSTDWLIHLEPTAVQPVVAESMGKQRNERLGEDVFIVGGTALRIAGAYEYGTGNVPPGTVNYPFAASAVRAVIEDLPGDWAAMRVEGMTMRGMMESLINARPGDWRESAGLRMEDSWFAAAKRRFFPDPNDMTDPRNVWVKLTGDPRYMNDRIDPEMASRVISMMSTFVYRTDFDEIEFLRQFQTAREELNRLRGQQGGFGSYSWDDVFITLSEARNLDEALGLFLRDERLLPLREALQAVMYPNRASDNAVRYAIDLGLLEQGPFANSFGVTVQSAQFMNLINMRSSLFQYLTQHYTPDTPDSLLDPVTGTVFGVPESKLRFAELLRALIVEASMQSLQRTRATEDLLTPALSAASRMGDPKAAAWYLGSMFLEAAETDPVTGIVSMHGMSNLLLLRNMALSGGQVSPLYRWGFEAFERELRRQWSGLNVIDSLEDHQDATMRASVFVLKRGPRLGSFDWFTGFLTRWNRVENESDLYRYFVGWRLNEMIRPYGLSLNESSMSSGGAILRDLALYRILPALGGYMAWRYVNTEMRHLFGYAPADLMADTFRMAQMGATRIMDVTGITSMKKFLVSEIPGMDLYFTPRNAEELEFYHRYGLSTVRYGRGWLSGSRSAFVGEGVYGNVPTWYRGIRSYWQAAPNADIATLQAYRRGDIPLPTPRNPLAPVFYVFRRALGISDRRWAERHVYDRPYPVAYRQQVQTRGTTEVSIGSESVAPLIPSARLLAFVAGREGAVGSGDVVRRSDRVDYRSFMLSVGMSPRLREELVTAPGAEGPVERGLPVSFNTGVVQNMQYRLREVFHRASEIQGLYGWLTRLTADALTDRESSIVTDSPGWAYSFQRRFWEFLYGGIDILPWQNELNELLRRFVFKRRPTEYVYYNPIPNNMPYWIPERLRYGDPYVRIHAGELRLPGAAYRWANPARFGLVRPGPHRIEEAEIAVLPAEALGLERAHQFAVLSGLEHAAGLRLELSDKVINRVVRRYIEQIPEDTPIYRNVITRDEANRVSAYTMLVVGEGRRANIVHAVPSGVDMKAARIGMMERMRQLGVRRGELLVVEDERTGRYRRVPVRLDERVLRPYLEGWREFRRELLDRAETGLLNEGLLYSPLQRFEVLADVAPRSPYYRRLRAQLAARESRLTEEERRRFEYAQEVAERTQERYHLYPYRDVPLQAREVVGLGLDDEGRLLVEGQVAPVRLAGIRLRLNEIKRRYGLAQNASREEALRRLAEEFGLQGRIELLHGGIRSRRAPRYVVRVRGRDVNRLLLRSGLAVRDEEDVSAEAMYLRRGPIRRLWTRFVDWLTHLDTPLHTKFLRVRSPLEEWERGHVFGTRAGSWEAPFSTYIKPTITAIMNKGPLSAALSGAILGAMFGFTAGAKEQGAMYGALLAAGLSLARTVVAPRGFIPARTRKRWEIEEYIDALQYTKYMRLAKQEAELAKRVEGVDVDRLLQDLQEQDRETERRRRRLESKLDRVRRQLSKRPTERLREEESRLVEEIERLNREPVRRRSKRTIDFRELGVHARRSLLYRAMAEQTALGVGTATRPGEALRTVRPYVRDIYRQILETGTPRERRRFYELLPDYQKVVFHNLLVPELPLPKRPDPTRLFRKYGLPGPSWRGWDPDVDLELLRAHLVERGGLDPIEAGVFPTERAVSRMVLEEVGVPTPTSQLHVASRLAAMFGEGQWQRLTGATVGTRLGSGYYTYIDYYDREYEKDVYRHYIRSLSSVA